MEWSTGDLVWFDTGLGHPLPGEIQEVHRAAQVIVVQAVINGKPQTFTFGFNETHLQPRQDLGPTGVDDMTQLEDLHEASLLWNLRLRYDNGIIYTYAGSILIAVNPYKMFPESYGIEMAKQYSNKPFDNSMAPHLFAIGSAAHAALPAPQVVIISGESGSGKTESTKLVMQYLAAVVPGGGTASAVITEQILEAAPLLEAFGNARTVRNDNSSRFGKYLEIYFKSGSIIGAKITQYLLEKSRIVTQAPAERNYHVFYELLGGLSETERAKYGLLDAEKYFYLNQGGTDCAPGRLDWSSLQGAMQVLGFSEPEREGIVRVLSSVLHLGNVYFHRRQLRHGQEGVELGSDAEIKWAAHLLQIPSEGILKSLTLRTTETRSEKLLTPLSIDQALDARDAFAKALYSGLFNWLVSRINSIIHKGGTHDAHRISILDIFGFEDLTENSFEQLCINYANESLQLYFNKHVFKLEQAEYARERLEWTPLVWEDNLPVIHLLAKKPVGIFHLLDDESNFPRASDLSFLEKCHYNHALNELYSRPRIGAQEFGITHYAGQVWYSVDGFLEKNRDALRIDVLELLNTSEQPLVLEMTKQMRIQRDLGKTLPRGANGRFVTMKPRTPTVAARFSDSLQQLLQSMAKCNPWFVRCVKPNNDKQALRMDMPCVLQQLRYLGMLDTIKIRKRGYPVRLRFQHFVDRYRHMLKQPIPRGTPYRDLCRFVLEELPPSGTEGPDFQLGATRVFLRESVHRQLENSRAERLKNAAVVIQKHARGMLTRKRWKAQRHGATVIQSAWRSHVTRKRFLQLRHAAIKAQALQRGRMARRRVTKMRAEYQRRKQMQKIQKDRQAQRAQKEQQVAAERNSMTHLDIPAELAFIISKSEGWTPVHGDRHLVKVVGTVPGPPVADDLPRDIDQFAFGKFSSVYCNGIKLTPRREPIQSPFLSRAAARDQDFQDALAIFKLILRWSGDPSLDTIKEKAIADYIVYKGLASRGLRDEILVQLCNQVYGIGEPQATRLWQLMAHCLSSFQPGPPFFKYLLKFIKDNATSPLQDILVKKLLRHSQGLQGSRGYPPSWLEWRATAKLSDIALSLTLPDNATQTVAIDSWTTCEEAAALAISTLNINNFGWTVTLEDGNLVTDSCGLDYVLDLLAEKELFPAFPAAKNDIFRVQGKDMAPVPEHEPQSPKRPQVPPPEPPVQTFKRGLSEPPVVPQKTSSKKLETADYTRKGSHEILSRESALNDRYFESEKAGRSRSLDNLLNDEPPEVPPPPQAPEPLTTLGLSESRLNDRYHSAERLAPLREPPPRFVKTGKRSHSSKYMERSEHSIRSSAMSDTSEAPSLASHVRRVRVPSQASDVDQFLDDLFSPVLDGSLDELSDARSLAASIRGSTINDFMEGPEIMSDDLQALSDSRYLSNRIKGGGDELPAADNSTDREVALINEGSLDEYITDLFQPIFVNDSLKKLTTKSELADSIKGGGAEASGTVLSKSDFNSPKINIPDGADPVEYQQHLQRAFLQSAMQQNLHIQQQLIAQNQALQTLLTQQNSNPTSPTNQKPIKKPANRIDATSTEKKPRKLFDGEASPPPPPPLPPPVESRDPQEARPFLDPYGRAKTVRIGKWRWPPPPQGQAGGEDFIHFKLRQKKQTSNGGNSHGVEWDEFDMEMNPKMVEMVRTEVISTKQQKQPRRSFEIGAERPSPNSVGKLKLSSEMRQRLEQVTSGHSVRSSTSNSERTAPAKLEDTRRAMLEAQLGGSMHSPDSAVKKQIQRMEQTKKIAPVWPMNVPPAPEKPPPPPPVRPPPNSNSKSHSSDLPAFVQRQERDTFGVRDNYGDSWGRAEAAKLDLVYETSFRKEIPIDRDRSRSRSRSRDRENFSEAVWDRSEVEGPSLNGTENREKEKREREFEHAQIMREKESNKVYQPSAKAKDKKTKGSSSQLATPTFKTHMAQKSAQKDRRMEPIPRISSSGGNKLHSTADTDKSDNAHNLPAPVIPAPVPASPSHKIAASACLTYNRVPWKLRVRKEIFSPTEPIGPPIALDLLFVQIACDVLGITPTLRISSEERQAAITLLSSHGITAENMKSQVRAIVKRHLVDMAREWPVYFARLFVVNGSPQMPDVSILAVSHNGVFLAKREGDTVNVVNSLTFNDLYTVTILPRPSALQICLRNGNRFTIYASKAHAIQSMVQSFLQEFKQVKGAVLSSGARQAAQILNVPIEHLEASIQHQNHHNNNDSATQMSNGHHHDSPQHQQSPRNGIDRHQTASPDDYPPQYVHRKNSLNTQESISPNSNHRNNNNNMMMMDDSTMQTQSNAKHSLLQFAIQHFRNDFVDDKSGRASDKRSSSGRGNTHADLVKWQNVPLRAPLLRLPPDLSPLALECFECILKYCGDLPMEPELTEVKCVYTILMHCHKFLALRDEVYCHLMKQTTSNRSPTPDSSQRAWRLISVLAAYFGCSDALKPYLIEHLTAAASDRRRTCHGTAGVCLSNLRKTARCGGRKNVPSVEEVTAVSAGRSARRQIYRLPGGAERVVNTRCSTVVSDVIAELCALLGIESEVEQQEFSLYCIVQGDAFTMPLAADEYILDVTTELLKSGQPFYLIFCRSVWHFPLKRDPAPTPLYIEVLFNQVAPDYLEGLLLELPGNGAPNPDYVRDMARIAAILHRAADLTHLPVLKEIKFLLPKPALALRELRPAQWVALVQSAWPAISGLTTIQVKAQFLNVLSNWPLFGSSFFAIKRVWTEDAPTDEPNALWKELILALNRKGVLFLDPITHETLQNWSYTEVISTRKVRSEDGALFLDMKVGNLLQQRIVRVQTEQAHEISRLVRQYITMAQMAYKDPRN